MTGSQELVAFISLAYRFAVTKLQPNDRWNIWRYLNEGIRRGGLHYHALVPLVIGESEDDIASTASLDLVAHSSLDTEGIPAGLGMICEFLERGVVNPGAVVAGLILLGDRNLMPAVTPLRKHLASRSAMAAAARCRTARLLDAPIDFWLTWAEELVERTDPAGQEAFSLCAVALVNLSTAASSESLFDAYRFYPSDEGGSIEPTRHWTLAAYAEHISPRLFALEARESVPKIMDKLIIAWGLV